MKGGTTLVIGCSIRFFLCNSLRLVSSSTLDTVIGESLQVKSGRFNSSIISQPKMGLIVTLILEVVPEFKDTNPQCQEVC